MSKSIFITGLGGTGKTAIYKLLLEAGFKAFDIESIPDLFTMFNTKTCKPASNVDINDLDFIKHSEWVCDIEKLQNLMKQQTDEIVFYCGTATNSDEMLPLFDKVFLLRVSEKILRERLNARKEGFGKARDVQKWIFSWKDAAENKLIGQGAIVINADHPLGVVADEIIEKSK